MANIVKKNEDQQFMKWNPMRAVRDLLRWDPFQEMAPLFPTFPAFERAEWNPSFDVTENQEAYLFKADVPGVKREDLEINITGNRLQVSGKRDFEKEAKTDTVYTYERLYGNFLRSFTLPEGIDVEHARSELKDGVLTLVIPKLPTAQAKKIPVAVATTKS